MSENKYFLSFIENINVMAASNAKKMEELIFTDAASAIVKARVFAEEVINEVFKQENINEPYVSTLYEKISYLSSEGYIKPDIQKAFDTIRYTGNKAAHSGEYNDISEACKLHKVMYNIGVWFYEVYSTVPLRIPAYEQPKPKNNIEDIVQQKIMEMLGSGSFIQPATPIDSEKTDEDDSSQEKEAKEDKGEELLRRDLQKGQSYLVRELTRLKDSSQEAIENANQFSRFKKYMHVERKIQCDLEDILTQNRERKNPNLILLCGSVGDGKSHLLAYIKENKPELLEGYKIFNDATESFSPNKNAMETLEEILSDFSDQLIEKSNAKVILAINMGVLHNFITAKHKEYTYQRLEGFVDNSDLFTQNVTTKYSEENFDLISFGDYHAYELTASGPQSSFYSELLKRVLTKSNENPFYLAFLEDEKENLSTVIHENYQFLQNEFVQKQIVELIIQTIVKKKLVISARAFLNFIADIMIPDDLSNLRMMTVFERLEYAVPSLLFKRKERSAILKALSSLDPIHIRSSTIDQLIIDVNTLNNWEAILDSKIQSEIGKEWLKPFIKEESATDYSYNQFSESIIRLSYLTNASFAETLKNKGYISFMKYLYYFNTKENKKIKEYYSEIKGAIYKWKGSPKQDYIYINKPNEKFRLAQTLNLKPTIDHLSSNTLDVLESFKSTILLGYTDGNEQNKIYLEIDYPLYQLLLKVQNGYRPNKKDEEDAIKFVEFIEKIMAFGNKKKMLMVQFPKENKLYHLKYDDFGSFVFVKEQ